jgi:hypothetical protein
VFSRRAPQPPDGTAHERRYHLCQCWPRLSVAWVGAEVCLDPVSAAQEASGSLRRCRSLVLPALRNTFCELLPSPFLTIADSFWPSSPIP